MNRLHIVLTVMVVMTRTLFAAHKALAEVFTGTAGDDYLKGGAEDDRLKGRAGNYYLDGGAGDNYLNGGGDDIRFSTVLPLEIMAPLSTAGTPPLFSYI